MKVPTVLVKTDMLSSWLQVKGATKSQLAAALGVSKGRVSQLFHASEIEPSAHLIAKLLKVTGLPFERLFLIAQQVPEKPNGGAARSEWPAASRRRKPAREPVSPEVSP
mgnify:CR=1 FL=1